MTQLRQDLRKLSSSQPDSVRNRPQRVKPSRLAWAVLVVTVLLLRPLPTLQAHGGGALKITNAPIGDCLVSVWSAPPAAKANTPLHITVGLSDAADGSPVLGATVQVAIYDQAEGAQVTAAFATTEQSVNKLFYEADLPPLAVGTYTVEVTTTCRTATDSVSFALQIRPSINPLFIIIPLMGTVLLVGFVLYQGWRKQGTAVTPVKKPHTRP